MNIKLKLILKLINCDKEQENKLKFLEKFTGQLYMYY